jgi:isocitrate/isopropylmalate dehydrogenase
MLLEHSLDAPEAAAGVRDAVSAVLAAGHRSADLILEGEDRPVVGCVAMGDLVIEQLEGVA